MIRCRVCPNCPKKAFIDNQSQHKKLGICFIFLFFLTLQILKKSVLPEIKLVWPNSYYVLL